MKHTPGPWFQSHRPVEGGYSTQVYDKDGKTIATMAWYSVPFGKIVTTNRLENAQLVAAAPDLLESLKSAIAVIEDLYQWEPIEAQHEETGYHWIGPRKLKPHRYLEFANAAGVPPKSMNANLDLFRSAIAKAEGKS
jgi:hypothetical protein